MQFNAMQSKAILRLKLEKKVSLHHHVKTKSLIQTCKGLCGILVVYSPYTMVYWWYTGGILVVYWWYTDCIFLFINYLFFHFLYWYSSIPK